MTDKHDYLLNVPIPLNWAQDKSDVIGIYIHLLEIQPQVSLVTAIQSFSFIFL